MLMSPSMLAERKELCGIMRSLDEENIEKAASPAFFKTYMF